MHDISYNNEFSDVAILQGIGEFIKARRIAQNLTQDETAEKAAVSRSTLSLAERGENISLLNLLKILRVLDALYVLDQLKSQRSVSPLQLAREDEKKRKRASGNNKQTGKQGMGW